MADIKGLTSKELEPYGHGYPTGKHDVSDRIIEVWREQARKFYEAGL